MSQMSSIEASLAKIAQDMAVIREQIILAEAGRKELRFDLVHAFDAVSVEIGEVKKKRQTRRRKSANSLCASPRWRVCWKFKSDGMRRLSRQRAVSKRTGFS
jgi:hypothetical protein